MDILRVNVCYRPLRIGWAIKSDDFQAYRKSVRYSNALWGGRFNPILFVDREAESSRLVDLFRVDVIIPIGNCANTKAFLDKYPYLIKPFFDSVFMKGSDLSDPWANVLDIHNALAFIYNKYGRKEFEELALHIHSWEEDDPLADVFLSQLGGFPNKDEIGTDYNELLKSYSPLKEIQFKKIDSIPSTAIDHPSVSYISRYGLKRHHSIASGWNYPGFFVGNATSLDDLVCHWNLRACDIPLWFIDTDHLERYKDILPTLEKDMTTKMENYRYEFNRKIAVWTRQEDPKKACEPFGESKLAVCQISDEIWNGRNVRAPMMHFGETSVLGVMGGEESKPKVSFSLSDKPFSNDSWCFRQHLIVSISLSGGLNEDGRHTFHPPFLPEINEFYARKMHFQYDKLRIEPGRIGIVITAAEHDSFLYALPVAELMERVFEMGGYEAELSNAGLITRQLITRLGGLQGGRIFKVPGVRRLLKTHGPNASITKKVALQTIGSLDPERPDAKFEDHCDLFIEPRPNGEKLTPDSVFGYLVEKGLFRVGADLNCPYCRMSSWVPLDSLKHRVVCDLCGHEHDVTRNLTKNDKWHFRRSGLLGVEKNVQGAIPVLLTLQQLDTTLHSFFNKCLYSSSLNLTPKLNNDTKKCETDFVWIIPRVYPKKTVIILAECKDKGPISTDDVRNLKRIADALPKKRFKTFVILSKISPFTKDEINIAKELNDKGRRRAILLTANELEPYFIGKSTREKYEKELSWNSPEEMADSTAQLYFTEDDVDTNNCK